jgi:hypothetical protein
VIISKDKKLELKKNNRKPEDERDSGEKFFFGLTQPI